MEKETKVESTEKVEKTKKEGEKETTNEKVEDINIKMDETKKRQVIIETDGNSIVLVKAEVAGAIELVGILQSVINNVGK